MLLVPKKAADEDVGCEWQYCPPSLPMPNSQNYRGNISPTPLNYQNWEGDWGSEKWVAVLPTLLFSPGYICEHRGSILLLPGTPSTKWQVTDKEMGHKWWNCPFSFSVFTPIIKQGGYWYHHHTLYWRGWRKKSGTWEVAFPNLFICTFIMCDTKEAHQYQLHIRSTGEGDRWKVGVVS